MIIAHLIYALLVGLAIAWIFGLALSTRGPWNSFFWFFFVIFLFTWGGGVWLTPFGPTGWGVSWMPFLLTGFFITLLLSAATPRTVEDSAPSSSEVTDTTNSEEQSVDEQRVETGLDVFFWLLIVFLMVVIFCHYILHPGDSMFWSH
jgi:hypothetical protein